jgi:hypothetical protein
MTLEETLRQSLTGHLSDEKSEVDVRIAARIAEEFAIGFAEWFADNTLRVDLDGYKTFGDTDKTKPHTVIELLEIYKKEKGL